LFALVCFIPNVTLADEVDDIVRAEMERQKIPGLSLAVVKDGKVVKEAGYGLANLEHQVPARPETIYQSGSVGKMFTAALGLLLVEDGKLGLDDPISKHLPEAPEAWKAITVRHLLNHTSGLGDPYTKLDFRKDYTDAEMLKVFGTMPLRFQPGEKWAYSNMGYQVLGILFTKVGGKHYAEQLRERVFQPAGMSTARLISERDIIPNRAAGYQYAGGEPKNQRWVSPTLNTTADGSIYLTVRDLVRWDVWLDGESSLKPASRQAWWTPAKLNDGKTHPYGMGWLLAPVNGRKCYSHGGAWQGFTSHVARFVDDRLTVIVLTNRSGCRPEAVSRAVAGWYWKQAGEKKGSN
jgi:CubicO group peptidase (beta-lactamase class C family)